MLNSTLKEILKPIMVIIIGGVIVGIVAALLLPPSINPFNWVLVVLAAGIYGIVVYKQTVKR